MWLQLSRENSRPASPTAAAAVTTGAAAAAAAKTTVADAAKKAEGEVRKGRAVSVDEAAKMVLESRKE